MTRTPREKARYYLQNEHAFRLGALPTEMSHAKTASLSQTIAQSTTDGIRMLMSVDEEIAPAMTRLMASAEYADLVDALVEAITTGKRVFFTGCGATGRLAILIEAAWRNFWQVLRKERPQLLDRVPNFEETFVSLMAGGDHALIRSVEGFEDSTDLGRYQLQQAGVAAGDVVVAVTEGGETSFVIGTAWQGLEAGARVFFAYNNPTEVLRCHVERSRELIEEPRVTNIDLFTGSMAVAGSTRMQATTSELLALGAAVELALGKVLQSSLSAEELKELGVDIRDSADFPHMFSRLLAQFESEDNVRAIARLIQWEEEAYRNCGLITYMTDRYLIDVLTDTTERAPTFRLPPFRKCDDTAAAQSWAFVKNPLCDTREAWRRLLAREPRGIDWPQSVYGTLDVAPSLRDDPPRLNNAEIHKFLIGNEDDPARYAADNSRLAMILVGEELAMEGPRREMFDRSFSQNATSFATTAAICIGTVCIDTVCIDTVCIDTARPDRSVEATFRVACDLPASPLDLWDRLAVKLVLNLMSTATMARMGRVEGNYMSKVETTNKKLIDRGTRLVAHLAGVDYDSACYALHEAMDAVNEQYRKTKDAPSPVAIAVENLRGGRPTASTDNNGNTKVPGQASTTNSCSSNNTTIT
ncbi:MAG: hypothetical protein U9N87_00675 [Planctomycetota bacterium]|nr:hypothetical protein [Planctomycetota bacterium]